MSGRFLKEGKSVIGTVECVCVCTPTSPGVVVVGHSVCGLDGGNAGLQGEQLAAQVWHAAGVSRGQRSEVKALCEGVMHEHTHWLLTGTMGELEKRSTPLPLLGEALDV